MKSSLLLLVLFLVLFNSCSREVVVSEEKLPYDIYYVNNKSKPFNGKCLIYYHHSKQLHYVFHYRNGILNGSYQSFFKNGNIKHQGNYVEGELDGKFLKYDEEGKLNFTCYFKKGALANNDSSIYVSSRKPPQ